MKRQEEYNYQYNNYYNLWIVLICSEVILHSGKMEEKMDLLTGLNPAQKEAVEHSEGPI